MSIPKAAIPNTITGLNMLFGFAAIIKAFEGEFEAAVWIIYLATFLDLLDGKLARILHASSKFGLEFDSLSDLVTFGVAPAVLMYNAFLHEWGLVGIGLSFTTCLFSALRLGRYNIEANPLVKKPQFKGIATPISAIILAGFVTFSEETLGGREKNIELAAFLAIAISFLMICNISFMGNTVTRSIASSSKILLYVVCIVSVGLFGTSMLFVWGGIYVGLGLGRWAFEEITERLDARASA